MLPRRNRSSNVSLLETLVSGEESKRAPKTQAALSGGPPKPPKKTARGQEDGSPDPGFTRLDSVKAKLSLIEGLIDEASTDLRQTGLSVARRNELEKLLKKMRDDKRRYQEQKNDLQRRKRIGE